MRSDTILNTLWAAVPLVVAAVGLRPVSDRQVRRFADRYSTPATPATEPLLRRLIFRTRALRMGTAAVGLSVPPLATAVGLHASNGLGLGVAGYLIGAFVAAVLPNQRRTRKRSASLLPRTAVNYVSRSELLAPAIAVAVSLAATLVYVFEHRTANPTYTGSTAGLAVAAIAAAATAVAVRIVVHRPQPAGSTDELAVDDAVRAHALHTLTAAGQAIALLGAAAALFQMGGYATSGAIHVAGIALGLIALVCALVAWFFRTAYWTVNRSFTS